MQSYCVEVPRRRNERLLRHNDNMNQGRDGENKK